mgnify:CR=1 FL=1
MKLTTHRLTVHLRHPWNIARMAQDSATAREALLVEIEHGGCTGWGESAPSRYYGQSIDSGERMLREVGRLIGDDPYALDAIQERLWAQFPGESAAIAAVDEALHDLLGKLEHIPTWKRLGIPCEPLPISSYSIGIDALDVVERKLHEAAAFPILKIKLGTPQDHDVLKVVRKVAPDKPLRVDANCGWSSADVAEHCKAIEPYDIELIEQPTPAGDHDGLADARALGVAPLIADESCVRVGDVEKCAGVFDGVNIKLSKCGGITPALQMIRKARDLGLQVMIGCMIETSVGIAAAAQLAPLADYIDLDGHLLLADDPFEGVAGEAGRIVLNDRPGLGVRRVSL